MEEGESFPRSVPCPSFLPLKAGEGRGGGEEDGNGRNARGVHPPAWASCLSGTAHTLSPAAGSRTRALRRVSLCVKGSFF